MQMGNINPKLYIVNCSVFDRNNAAGKVECKNNMDEETHPFVMFIVYLAIEWFLNYVEGHQVTLDLLI